MRRQSGGPEPSASARSAEIEPTSGVIASVAAGHLPGAIEMNAQQKNKLFEEAYLKLKMALHYAENQKRSPHSSAAADTLMQVTVSAGKAVRNYVNAVKQDQNNKNIIMSDIRCRNCSRLFDVMKAEVGDRYLENSLTGLKDINNPWVKCPHCGFTM
jgi:hypothetical protein